MILKDSFIIEAPIDNVWALLQDVHRVSTCVPGVGSVKEVGRDMYNGILKVKVGPISPSFQGQVRLTEQTYPPGRLVAEMSPLRVAFHQSSGSCSAQLGLGVWRG